MKRRLLSIFLSLTMILSMVPSVWAADEMQQADPAAQETETPAKPAMNGNCGATKEDHVTWALTKNTDGTTYTLTISGDGAMADYAVGKAPWHVALSEAANRKQINQIELSSGLTRIGDNAFLQASVTDVEIPDTVISIGTNAFWNCNTIQTILPASVRELGATAFYGTFVVKVDANSPYFCSEEDGKILYNKDKTTLYQVSQDCTGNFTIPSTVTTINDFAMNGCAKVTGELVIPNSVQTIGVSAFESSGFTSLTLGNSVKEIGKSAFYKCTTMTGDLVIPASVTTIGENAFASTGFNGKLDFQAQIEEFPAAIFKGLNFTAVSFSDSVKTIGDRAFENCKQLATVTFGQGLETIGSFAFEGSGISGELTFPDSLKRIKAYAFSNCLGITEIDFPEGNATIEYAAFTGDTGVQKIKIPLSEIQFDKLNNGGYYIFTNYSQNKLETIVVGTAPSENSMSLFSNSLAGLKTIVIGTDVSKINRSAFAPAESLESALYPSNLDIDNEWNDNHHLIDAGTKYTVAANGSMGQNTEQAMLTFVTPEGKTCPAVTYLSTNESAVTVDANGKIKAVGSVGQKATIKAQYDGTTFAKVDVTIGTSAGEDFYSIDPVIADQTYTGTELKPAVKVTKNGEVIETGYSVEYSANTNVGTATATVKVGDTVIGTATFNIVKAAPTVKITADPTSLTGSGTVKLTVTSKGVPTDGEIKVTCDNDITVTENEDGISATLPNATKTYTFTASYNGDANHEKASGTCQVSVTRRSSSGGSSSSDRSYAVTAPSTKNGDVTVSPKNASKGDHVTITVTPDKGYELDSLTVKDASGNKLKLTDKGNGKYTFTMPGSKVTVSAEFVEEQAASIFADVPADAYYAKAVEWAVKKGITNGKANGLFGSNDPCTRGQIVTFLWRAAGSPAPKGTAKVPADVLPGSYCYDAVAWALENGITNGLADGTFGVNSTCTRGQSVTFLFRAIGKLVDSKAEFSDVLTDSYYANAVAWAVENGVTNGIGGGLFGPNNSCTRAQIVTFLFRAYQGK